MTATQTKSRRPKEDAAPRVAPAARPDKETTAGYRRKKVVRITRAKLLDEAGFNRVLSGVRRDNYPLRNEALLRLSVFCGLRAQEIAGLQWERHLLDAHGEVVHTLRVTQDIAKGRNARIVERDIPLDPTLRDVLRRLRAARPNDEFVIYRLNDPKKFVGGRKNRTEDNSVDPNTLVQFFRRLYAKYGLEGCTSHSGRRTFITNLARRCNEEDASLVDVAELAGHRNLNTTAAYVEPSARQRKLVTRVFR